MRRSPFRDRTAESLAGALCTAEEPLGDPGATSGNGAQSWGLWSQDPGPRGCKLDRYDQLKAVGGVAPSLTPKPPRIVFSQSSHPLC
jgi:hypothetical protein